MPTVAGQTTTWNVFHYTDLNALINIVHKGSADFSGW